MRTMYTRRTGLAALGVTAVLLAGCTQLRGNTNVNTNANTNTNVNQAMDDTGKDDDAMMEKKSVTVTLATQNNSGEQGTAELKSEDGKTKVELMVTGAPADIAQPAHIHLNSCATIGGVKYPLTNVVNGKSETMIDVSLDELLAMLPLSINVHKSAAEAGIYVACGDIKKDGSAMMEDKKDDSMMEDEKDKDDDAMMKGEVKQFTVQAMNFGYDVKEIKVKKGDTVKIHFVNKEGFHDLRLDEFSIATSKINGGQVEDVSFTASKTGTFEYYCSVGQHRAMGMVGKLIVE